MDSHNPATKPTKKRQRPGTEDADMEMEDEAAQITDAVPVKDRKKIKVRRR